MSSLNVTVKQPLGPITVKDFINKFNKTNGDIGRNCKVLTTRTDWSKCNLRGLVLFVKEDFYGNGKDKKKKTDLNVMVLPFRPDDFKSFSKKRVVYDPYSNTANLVVIPPPKDSNDKTKIDDRLPADASDWDYYPVKPFDLIFFSMFDYKVPTTKAGSIVDLVDIRAQEWNGKEGNSGVSIRVNAIQFFKTKFEPFTVFQTLNSIPYENCLLSKVNASELQKKSRVSILHFSGIEQPTEEDLARSSFIYAKLTPTTDPESFVSKYGPENNKQYANCAKLTAFVNQWRGGIQNMENILLQFILWDDQLECFGIRDPSNWKRFAPYFLRCPFTCIFDINKESTISNPINRAKHEVVQKNSSSTTKSITNSQREDDSVFKDDDDDDAFEEKDPMQEFNFSLVIRTKLVHFFTTSFFVKHSVPVSVEYLKKNPKIYTENKKPNDENKMNRGLTSSRNTIFCVSESMKNIKEFIQQQKNGEGEFRIISSCLPTIEKMKEFENMNTKQGEEYINNLNPGTQEDPTRHYVYFITKEAFNHVKNDGDKLLLAKCESAMRIKLISESNKSNSRQPSSSQLLLTDSTKPSTSKVATNNNNNQPVITDVTASSQSLGKKLSEASEKNNRNSSSHNSNRKRKHHHHHHQRTIKEDEDEIGVNFDDDDEDDDESESQSQSQQDTRRQPSARNNTPKKRSKPSSSSSNKASGVTSHRHRSTRT